MPAIFFVVTVSSATKPPRPSKRMEKIIQNKKRQLYRDKNIQSTAVLLASWYSLSSLMYVKSDKR